MYPVPLYLFNIYSERIIRDVKAEFEGGVQIGGERLNNLRFADDTVLLLQQQRRSNRHDPAGEGQKCGKTTSPLRKKKTKILVVDSNREDTSAFKINGEEIEEVVDVIYLGSTITNKGNSAPEIKRWLAMAREAVSKMCNIWRSRRVSLNLKLRVLHGPLPSP